MSLNKNPNPFKTNRPEDIENITPVQNTVDMSLLSDTERLYYMRTGKLPPSPKMMEMMRSNALNMRDDENDIHTKQMNNNAQQTNDSIQHVVESNISNTHTPDSATINNTSEQIEDNNTNVESISTVPIGNLFNTSEHVVLNNDNAVEEIHHDEHDNENKLIYTPTTNVVEYENSTPVEESFTVEEMYSPTTVIEDNIIGTQYDNDITEKQDDEVVNNDNYKNNVDETIDTTDEDVSNFNDEEFGYIAPDETNINAYNRFFDDARSLSKGFDLTDTESARKFENVLSDTNGPMFSRQLLNTYTTAERDFDQSALNKLSTKDILNQDTPAELLVRNSKSTINSAAIKNKDKVVTGRQAKVLINAKIRGAKKIFLYNSGFYVTVRPLTNLEISEYTNTLRNENNEYGKIMGGHFYLYSGLFIKKFFAERLLNIVEDCNLVGWKKGNTLLDNLSLHDYRTILWACASLMYKDGIDFTKICSFCGAKETIKMNLDKLYFANFGPIKNSAYPYISQKSSVEPSDIEEYKRRIEYNIPHEITVPNWKFLLKVPSVNEYIFFAEMFLNELRTHVDDLSNIEKIQEHVRFMHLKQFAPWIKEIQSLDSNGNIEFKINDAVTIFDIISDCDAESNDFIKRIEDYIQSTMLTYIAFPYMKCPNPNCGKVPENIVNGFVSYDIESAFFTMSVRKFKNIISRLGD